VTKYINQTKFLINSDFWLTSTTLSDHLGAEFLLRDFQVKKYPKFSCGMDVLTRPVPRAGKTGTELAEVCLPHKMNNLFLGNPLV
jgi:predicted PolB exonuclease-like 3'-5' exonuclease